MLTSFGTEFRIQVVTSFGVVRAGALRIENASLPVRLRPYFAQIVLVEAMNCSNARSSERNSSWNIL